MTKQIDKMKLLRMAKAEQRKKAIADGYYDGRFRERIVADKRHKDPKHKNWGFEY